MGWGHIEPWVFLHSKRNRAGSFSSFTANTFGMGRCVPSAPTRKSDSQTIIVPSVRDNRKRWNSFPPTDREEVAAAAAAKSLQSCPTLCDPTDSSPPGSPVLGILQARTLDWAAISLSNASKWKVKSEDAQSCLTLRNPMDCSLPGSSSIGFSRQES